MSSVIQPVCWLQLMRLHSEQRKSCWQHLRGWGVKLHLWRLCGRSPTPWFPCRNSGFCLIPLRNTANSLRYRTYFSFQWPLLSVGHRTKIVAVACTHWNQILIGQLIHRMLFIIASLFLLDHLKKSKRRALRIRDTEIRSLREETENPGGEGRRGDIR